MVEWRIAHGQSAAHSRQGSLPLIRRPADGGSDFQRTPLTYAVDRLRHHFRDRRDVYVSGNLLLYYREGDPRAVVAPDVFVVLGVSNADRSSYRLWEERKGPDFAGPVRTTSGLVQQQAMFARMRDARPLSPGG